MRQVPSRPIPLWWRQANFQSFREAYAEQYQDFDESNLLLFVGSGVSMNADPGRMKSWAGLLHELAGSHGGGAANGASPLCERITRILNREDDALRFLDAGTELRNAYSDKELRATLNDLLNGPEISNLPSPVHRDLAHVPWRRIITTNYDCLIENAYAREHREKPRVVHPGHTDLHPVEQITGRAIYKIHGDIADPHSTLVLARAEYDQLYVEGRGSNKFMLSLATPIRTSKLILFLGYGHSDQYFNRLWNLVSEGHNAKVFAFMPIEGPLSDFEKSVERLAVDGIQVIGYSLDDGYAELGEFAEYLRYFDSRDPEYVQAASQQRPTVVMVYCGGTIGARQPEDPLSPLSVNRQPSRYGLELRDYKDRLLNWYREFHHAGNDLPELDVVWEILPEEHQMFSENATPEYWSVLTRSVEAVVDKYMLAPREIGADGTGGVLTERCKRHFSEDQRQWKERTRKRPAPAADAVPPPGAEEEPEELSLKTCVNDLCNRYVLGVVLLAGTDTLAYSAGALSVGMQHLPCPVVLTGSSQPPSSIHLPVNQRGRFFTTSDAWRNLMTTLYFLQSFGHTLTEVFVCFAETVHHGVNLRKVATGGIPYARDPAGRRGGEHFTFRNLSYRSHYMFRMIDGLFCNNFYPRDGITFAALVGQDRDEFLDLRHVRHPTDTPREQIRTYGFSNRVWHLKATPCAPEVDVTALRRRNALPTVVLLEGYTSGTYATQRGSPFFKLMEDLDRVGVPFVVTAPYGLRPTGLAYQIGDSRHTRKPIPTLPLFGATEETALPLLCRMVDEIERDPAKREQWKDPDTGSGTRSVTQARIDLLRKEVDRFFHQRPNLITEELGGLTDRDKNIGRRDRLAAESRSSERIAHGWDPRFGIFDALKRQVRGGESAGETPERKQEREKERRRAVQLSREGFTAMVDEIVRPYLRVGAAPDGFAVLSNIGFEMGLGIVGTVGDWSRTQYPLKRFRDRGPDQGKALEEASQVLRKVAEICRESGVAAVEIQRDIETSPPLERWQDGDPAEWLRFGVRLERHDSNEWMHEKYAVVSFSPDDHDFFNLLMTGQPRDSTPERALRTREEAFTDLLLNRWQHNLSGVDWFLLGLWKGVACGIARGLRFDSLAVEGRHMQPGHLRALRQAVRCEILFGNPHAFGMEFTYHAIGEQSSAAARQADTREPAGLLTSGLAPGASLPVRVEVANPATLNGEAAQPV